jgi:peptide/nickel transport system substrate-binding protein
MQNRFGVKDFLLLVLVAAIGVLVLLSMKQRDREWEQLMKIREKLAQIESAAASGGSNVDLSGVVNELKQFAASAASAGAAAPVGREESWARPGVPITWPKRYAYGNDPKSVPGFKTGGEFTELFEAQPQKITPYISSDVYGRRVIDIVAETAATLDPETLEMRGLLAEAWQLDPDGRWLRVRIDPRARFSDGTPVTAEDFRWTFMDFVRNTEVEAERTRSTMDMIDDVVVIDDRTVEYLFNKAVFTNLSYTLGLYVLPKGFYSKFEPSQVNSATGLLLGSGPYKLETLDPANQWSPGTDVVLVRNERYWGNSLGNRPPLERRRFKVVNDELSRLVAYRKGEGDMMMPSAPQFVKTRTEPGWDDGHFSLNWVNMRSGYSFIAWNAGPRNGKLTPFHDRRVRLAMTHLIDRERMIRDIYEGIGVVAKGPTNPESPASNPAIQPWPYDPARAKELLAEAGWTDRDGDGVLENEAGDEFTFEFTRPSGGEIAERMSNFIKDACTKAGIRMEVRVLDWSVMQDMQKRRDFDALTMGWSANAPESDPRQIFHSSSIEDQGDNFVQWRSAEADELIDRGRTTMDTAERMLIWHELDRVMHEEQPYTFLRVVPWLRFVSRDFGNVNAYKVGLDPLEFVKVGPAAATPAN